MRYLCGGCAGLGSHKRWCHTAVGARANILGTASERAEGIADTVGANFPEGANALYRVSSLLKEEALRSKEEWLQLNSGCDN